eukprot:6482507-Amphidinium_carterae.1
MSRWAYTSDRRVVRENRNHIWPNRRPKLRSQFAMMGQLPEVSSHIFANARAILGQSHAVQESVCISASVSPANLAIASGRDTFLEEPIGSPPTATSQI